MDNRGQPRLLWWRKLGHDIRSYLLGNADFALVEEAFTSWLYPLDLEFTLQRADLYYAPRDAEGLPMRHYLTVGVQYNPTRIAAYALAHFNRYERTRDEESKAAFFKAVEWFMRAPDARWAYPFPWLDLRPPWLSAMAQGEGISVLVRAWVLTHQQRYLTQAQRALEPLIQPIEAGGVRSSLDDGRPFLEEYPTQTPDHVLNGFLYALIGLLDLARVVPSAVAPVGLDALLDSLEQHLAAWDAGFWSLYDLGYRRTGRPNLATVSYHNLHVTQLTFVGRVTQRRRLVQMAERWAQDARRLACRLRAFGAKVRYRVQEPGLK